MNFIRLVATALRVIRTEGLRGFVWRSRKRLRAAVLGATPDLAVKTVDALAADWTRPPEQVIHPRRVSPGPLTLAWITSPPSPNSGGHQNLFRFIDFSERAGHRCRVYFYTNTPVVVKSDDMRASLRDSGNYPDIAASMEMYDRGAGVGNDVDAIFATGWETAYPAFLDPSNARRLYFVQDFEPGFYPLGSASMLAENTYRFGFQAITAGGWLSHKLSTEYGMRAEHFDFAVDPSRYFVKNTEQRSEVFFYARPTTPRRGLELGLMALEEFAARRPGVAINLAGADMGGWDLPFPFRNLAMMDLAALNDVYNRCAAGLVISASNMSLLPLELMASGATPVVNDAPNNRMVSDNPYIAYVSSSPGAMADRLIEVVDQPDHGARARAMSASLDGLTWEHSGAQFLAALERLVRD